MIEYGPGSAAEMEAAIPIEDQVCFCGHWYDEHSRTDAEGPAHCESCYQSEVPDNGDEHDFAFDWKENTPEAIADRGGDPDLWPQHIKDYFGRKA
jgi:hypothetical protein